MSKRSVAQLLRRPCCFNNDTHWSAGLLHRTQCMRDDGKSTLWLLKGFSGTSSLDDCWSILTYFQGVNLDSDFLLMVWSEPSEKVWFPKHKPAGSDHNVQQKAVLTSCGSMTQWPPDIVRPLPHQHVLCKITIVGANLSVILQSKKEKGSNRFSTSMQVYAETTTQTTVALIRAHISGPTVPFNSIYSHIKLNSLLSLYHP